MTEKNIQDEIEQTSKLTDDVKDFNDDYIKEVVQEYGLDDSSTGEIAKKIFTNHKASVSRLQTKNGEVIQKGNEYRDRANALQTQLDEERAKVANLEKNVKDMEAQVNEFAKAKDIDVDEIVEKRVKSIREESERETQILSEKVTDLNMELDRLQVEKLDQRLDYEINNVAMAIGIPEHAREDFKLHTRSRFSWDKEDNRFIGRDPITSEIIHNDANPVEIATIQTYADKNLRSIRPHYFQSMSNTIGLNGSTQTQEDLSALFNKSGTPTLEGFKYRDKIGEESFNKLQARFNRNKGT